MLTGATGFLGYFLLREAINQGHEVALLIRPHQSHTPRQRFRNLLHSMAGELQREPKVRLLSGGLTKPDLGLSSEDQSWVEENVSRVLHNAGSVQFQADPNTDEPYATNVGGTRMLLAFCQELGITEFHHVSTAYVCGRQTGGLLESELERGQTFYNAYERSKYLAELLVRQATFLSHRSIYRPSVILGDSQTGKAPSFESAYQLLKGAWLLASRGFPPKEVLRVLKLSDKRMNLVTGEWCARVIWELAGSQTSRGKTYHLTHPDPVLFSEMYAALTKRTESLPLGEVGSLDFDSLDLDSPDLDSLDLGILGLGPVEKVLLDTYAPYLREHCLFDRSQLEADAPHCSCPTLTTEILEKLTAYAVNSGFRNHYSYDLGAFLDSLELTDGEPRCRIELSGPEGRTWDLSLSSERLSRVQGATADLPRIICSQATLSALIGGHWSLEEALYSGGLVVESAGQETEPAEEMLGRLVAEMAGVAP